MDIKIQEAVKVLKNGGIVIFPTDTAYGIGCRMDNEKSIKRLFEIRKRSESKPLLALVDSIEMAQDYLLPIPKKVTDNIIKKYWPGSVTIILNCITQKVPELVRGGGNTLGVRLPNNSQLLELIKEVGVPVVAPSANFAGEQTPFSFQDLDERLIKSSDYALEGNIDSNKKTSTIIDCTVEPWKIIRKGAVEIQKSKLKSTSLYIDTTNRDVIKIKLRIEGKEYARERKIGNKKKQIVLPMIDSLLKKHKVKLEDIHEIEVNVGPGSFTGIRVGTSIANALGFVLGIPVKEVK